MYRNYIILVKKSQLDDLIPITKRGVQLEPKGENLRRSDY